MRHGIGAVVRDKLEQRLVAGEESEQRDQRLDDAENLEIDAGSFFARCADDDRHHAGGEMNEVVRVN
jgi:hypothetical protein